jgi:hypothetical protein
MEQAEDAAAKALAKLLLEAMYRHPCSGSYLGPHALEEACRDVLRGQLAEDGTRQLGSYCMRAPADPRLAALLHAGAQIVELAYTVRDPVRAYAEACRELLAAANPKGDLT